MYVQTGAPMTPVYAQPAYMAAPVCGQPVVMGQLPGVVIVQAVIPLPDKRPIGAGLGCYWVFLIIALVLAIVALATEWATASASGQTAKFMVSYLDVDALSASWGVDKKVSYSSTQFDYLVSYCSIFKDLKNAIASSLALGVIALILIIITAILTSIFMWRHSTPMLVGWINLPVMLAALIVSFATLSPMSNVANTASPSGGCSTRLAIWKIVVGGTGSVLSLINGIILVVTLIVGVIDTIRAKNWHALKATQMGGRVA